MKHPTGPLYGNTKVPGRRCVACGGPSGPLRVCGKPKCLVEQRRRMRAYDAARRERRAQVCRFCQARSLDGRKVCATHQFRRLPCPMFGQVEGCTGRVPYNDHARKQAIYCSYRCKEAQKRIWAKQSFFVRPHRDESERRVSIAEPQG